jgi:hypothetical protein
MEFIMSKVISKRISGFSNYSVTNEGEVISHKFGKNHVLSTSTTTGYHQVTLVSDDGVPKGFQVHRLVALTFLKNPKNHKIVNHIDGKKLNNALVNLEWTDRKSNAQHYEAVIKPKNIKDKKEKIQNDLVARLNLINYATTACTNPEMFQTMVLAALDGYKA